MLEVDRDHWPELAGWFAPERPGPLIHQQVLHTGRGRCRVDRWPDPRVVLAETAGNYALRGDPDRLDPAELADVTGFVEAPPEWAPALRAADPGLAVWDRLIAVLPAGAALPEPVGGGSDEVRRLGPADSGLLRGYDPEGTWIWETWGGAHELAAAGVAHGAVVEGRLVSVAVPFYVGARHADLGVVTDPGHRSRGLSTRCAAAVAADVRAGGRIPTWTTSPDNTASLAVAARLGFVRHREDVLYAVRAPIPT